MNTMNILRKAEIEGVGMVILTKEKNHETKKEYFEITTWNHDEDEPNKKCYRESSSVNLELETSWEKICEYFGFEIKLLLKYYGKIEEVVK